MREIDAVLFDLGGVFTESPFDAIETLEQEFGVTVMTSLQAIVWNALRRCGVDDRIDGYGRLFREF